MLPLTALLQLKFKNLVKDLQRHTANELHFRRSSSKSTLPHAAAAAKQPSWRL
jgi:hypothetical protein